MVVVRARPLVDASLNAMLVMWCLQTLWLKRAWWFNTTVTIRYEDLLMLEAILELKSPTQPYGASTETLRLIRPFLLPSIRTKSEQQYDC